MLEYINEWGRAILRHCSKNICTCIVYPNQSIILCNPTHYTQFYKRCGLLDSMEHGDIFQIDLFCLWGHSTLLGKPNVILNPLNIQAKGL